MQDRPLDLHVPFWATPSFKWLVIGVVMSLSVMVVFVFEIIPKLNNRMKRPTAALEPLPAGTRQIRFDGVLDKAHDGTPIDTTEEPYVRLVRHLETTSPEDLDKGAKEYAYGHFAQSPDRLRGETVKVIAILGDSYPLRLDKPIEGKEWIYHTVVVDLSGAEGYVFDLIDYDPATNPLPKLPPRQLVQVEGIFLKNATYPAVDANGKDITRTAPFFVGKRLVPFQEKSAAAGTNLNMLVIALAGVSVILVTFLSVRVFRQVRRGSVSRLPVSKIP